MGELLPGWRQQDLLGATGPGLLREKKQSAAMEQKHPNYDVYRFFVRHAAAKSPMINWTH